MHLLPSRSRLRSAAHHAEGYHKNASALTVTTTAHQPAVQHCVSCGVLDTRESCMPLETLKRLFFTQSAARLHGRALALQQGEVRDQLRVLGRLLLRCLPSRVRLRLR